MAERPFRYAGYEIDRKQMRQVEEEIRLYPVRRARLEMLEAKWADRTPVDYHTYRSPGGDSMPGAPEHVSDPTGDRVAQMENQRIEEANKHYLRTWLEGMDDILDNRLDKIQRELMTRYYMVPPSQRKDVLDSLLTELCASRSQAYHWLNGALLQFAFYVLDERFITRAQKPDYDRTNSGLTPDTAAGNQ